MKAPDASCLALGVLAERSPGIGVGAGVTMGEVMGEASGDDEIALEANAAMGTSVNVIAISAANARLRVLCIAISVMPGSIAKIRLRAD